MTWINVALASITVFSAFFTWLQKREVNASKKIDIEAAAHVLAQQELSRLWKLIELQGEQLGKLEQQIVDLRKHKHDEANKANILSLKNAELMIEVKMLRDQVTHLQETLERTLADLAFYRGKFEERNGGDSPGAET